jgi:DNA-binding transcriptional ArsR family regulator
MPMIQAEAALFRSLGDPARLAIVRRLATGPARVVDLTRALGLAQSTVSGHLACLRDCGLAAARPQGRASVWSLTQPALLDLLSTAEAVLAATAVAAAAASPDTPLALGREDATAELDRGRLMSVQEAAANASSADPDPYGSELARVSARVSPTMARWPR